MTTLSIKQIYMILEAWDCHLFTFVFFAVYNNLQSIALWPEKAMKGDKDT